MGGLQNDVGTIPAVAAVRTTAGNKLFTPQADTAITACAGSEIDLNAVDEQGKSLERGERKRGRLKVGERGSGSEGVRKSRSSRAVYILLP